jgi:hypothetical protein
MTKLEEIGRALAARTPYVQMLGGTVNGRVPSDDGPIPLWQLHAKTARFVVEQLLEPSPAMVEAGEKVPVQANTAMGTTYPDNPDAIWRVMVQALLKEGSTE